MRDGKTLKNNNFKKNNRKTKTDISASDWNKICIP